MKEEIIMNNNMNVVEAIDFLLSSYVLPDGVYECLEEYRDAVTATFENQ